MSEFTYVGKWVYVTCGDCGKPVRLNKALGSLHICLSPCERAKRHLGLQVRRRGPFWNRRNEAYCESCGHVWKDVD